MPREFFVAPLICTTDQLGTHCAPKVDKTVANFVSACQDSTVPNAQCLVLLAGDTTSAKNDTSLVTLVADNFDTPIASLPTNVRNRINNGLTSKSIALNINDYVLVRDFLTALGLLFDPNFVLENFWISS